MSHILNFSNSEEANANEGENLNFQEIHEIYEDSGSISNLNNTNPNPCSLNNLQTISYYSKPVKLQINLIKVFSFQNII
jgi:hypothetical protein